MTNATLESLFPLWITFRKEESSVKDKTIKENIFLWNAYIKGQEISKKPLVSLMPLDYIIFFRQITKNRCMTRKRFNDMKSILNGILYYSIEKGIILHNPLSDINYRQFAFKPEVSTSTPYSIEERQQLLDYISEDDLYDLAIKLDFHLVLRIGELKALRFDDIQGPFIMIQRFMNDKNIIENDIKGHTESGYRLLPITKECRRLINRIKTINPNSEYLFIKDDQPLTTATFNRRLMKYCKELDIVYRSSHKIRFTTSSILFEKGMSMTQIQKLLGHSSLNMTSHYLRNILSKNEIWEKVNSILG